MSSSTDLRIEPIADPADFPAFFAVCASSFGGQTNDAIWTGLNHGWDTPEGLARGIKAMTHSFNAVTNTDDGHPHTVFLKATFPASVCSSPATAKLDVNGRILAGSAIWVQNSFVPGYGCPPASDILAKSNAAERMSPDEKQRRFVAQMWKSLIERRVAVVQEKAAAWSASKQEVARTPVPAVFALDLCAVDPEFQRKGAAAALVKWGLEEAKNRGGLECVTEGSSMGRGVYVKLGMRPEKDDQGKEKGDIVFAVDEEFKGRKMPPNVFLRTVS